MPGQPACIFGDDEGGACETPPASILTAGGVKHPVCHRHRDAAEDRLTDLELGRVVAEQVLPAEGDEGWHWCDSILLHVYELDPPPSACSARPRRGWWSGCGAGSRCRWRIGGGWRG